MQSFIIIKQTKILNEIKSRSSYSLSSRGSFDLLFRYFASSTQFRERFLVQGNSWELMVLSQQVQQEIPNRRFSLKLHLDLRSACDQAIQTNIQKRYHLPLEYRCIDERSKLTTMDILLRTKISGTCIHTICAHQGRARFMGKWHQLNFKSTSDRPRLRTNGSSIKGPDKLASIGYANGRKQHA